MTKNYIFAYLHVMTRWIQQ